MSAANIIYKRTYTLIMHYFLLFTYSITLFYLSSASRSNSFVLSAYLTWLIMFDNLVTLTLSFYPFTNILTGPLP